MPKPTRKKLWLGPVGPPNKTRALRLCFKAASLGLHFKVGLSSLPLSKDSEPGDIGHLLELCAPAIRVKC